MTRCERVVEVVDLVERRDLGLVGEEDVDVGLDEVEELVAVALDAERVGQRERDPAGRRRARCAAAMRNASLRRGLVPEVALEVQ